MPTASCPPRMMPVERRRLERPMVLMVWLSIASFSLAEEKAFYALAGSLAVALHFWATYRGRELYVSRLIAMAGALVATAVAALEMWRASKLGLGALEPLGHFLILVQLCKLFERKSHRDYVLIIALSSLLMTAAAVICQELWFALTMLVYLALTCYTAMVLNLKRGLDKAAAARLTAQRASAPSQKLAWNVNPDWPPRAVLWTTGWLLATALGCGILTFLLGPRLQAIERTLLPSAQGLGGGVGFADSVSLRSPKLLQPSDRELMRISLQTPQGLDRPNELYLRGQTFNSYADSRWFNRAQTDLSPMLGPLPSPPEELMENAIRQEVSMESFLLPRVFAISPAVAADSDGRNMENSIHVTWDMNLLFPVPPLPSRFTAYTIYSWPQPLTDAQRQYLRCQRERLGLDPLGFGAKVHVTQAVEDLARSWCQDLLDNRQEQEDRRDELDLAIARRLAQRLVGNYTYSLDLSGARSDLDGVEDFLFHLRKGHCEYFASALAVMCRSLGVTARVASGFHLSEGNRFGSQYVVRSRDAHAWTEVFTPGTDWVVVDATPPCHRLASSGVGLWSHVRNFWGRLKLAWFEKVVSYNAVGRKKVNDFVAQAVACLASTAKRGLSAVKEGCLRLLTSGRLDEATAFLAALIGVATAAIAAVLVLGRRKRLGHRHLAGPEVRFMKQLVALLRRRGLKPSPSTTPLELAEQATQKLAMPRQPLEQLVGLYYRIRWGKCRIPAAELAQAEQAVRALHRVVVGKGT